MFEGCIFECLIFSFKILENIYAKLFLLFKKEINYYL